MLPKTVILLMAGAFVIAAHINAATIYQSTLEETNQPGQEMSTTELREALGDIRVKVFDARPYREYAIGHIPGAMHVGGKPGATSAHYTSDANAIAAIIGKDKSKRIVVYCSGPYCGRSKRAAKELLENGYTNVWRYQLGIPVWRALGGVTVIEPDGLKQLYGRDQTAVWLDVREPSDYQEGTLPGAYNLPHRGVVQGEVLNQARQDGRLPVEDHNTRIIVFGENGVQAREVAEALTQKAFHNVAFFCGSFQKMQEAFR